MESSSSLSGATVAQLNYEPFLDADSKRYVIFPIQHDDIWQFYKRHLAAFWTVEEIDLSKDVGHWRDKLDDDERKFLSLILAFFAVSDGLVGENLAENFLRRVQVIEARCFYSFQCAMENVHGEMYSLLIDTLIPTNNAKQALFRAAETNAAVRRKVDWMLEWINGGTFAEQVIAFACVEGIFFSGEFAAIFWIGERGIMPGLRLSNQFIARDEGLHRDFACLLHNKKIVNKTSPLKIAQIVEDAVNVELLFFDEALHETRLVGMNKSLMNQYVQYVADNLLVALSCPKRYNVANPFQFMNNISLEGKSNFFESRVSEYQKSGVLTDDRGDNGFNFSADVEF